ncbi:MAG: tetratricopeptide repeat protein [Planctomycetia bacterium]|nr:tetratricopeptide repeat protein [Planctomycetia bacterium]
MALLLAGRTEHAILSLEEARERFRAIANAQANTAAEGMTAVCLADQGTCLLQLGRLDEAAAACDECIRLAQQLGDDRQVAVSKGQLGIVRFEQCRYPEALAAQIEARELFTRFNEPGNVAIGWHEIGMIYQEMGHAETAEDAFRQALAICTRTGNCDGEARSLAQLGTLYSDELSRPEQGASLIRQAADIHASLQNKIEEGRQRSNLACTLRKLRRYDDARQEIHDALKCLEQFGHSAAAWMAWAILADIEADAGIAQAATEARNNAIDCYLAYRRDGGENHLPQGRLCAHVAQSLLVGDGQATVNLLKQLIAKAKTPVELAYFHVLQAIASGSRDVTLADHAEFDYTVAAEILHLIETLEKHRPG